MWELLQEDSRPELNDPVLVVSLSTSIQQYRALYSHARELSKYMLKKMKFEKLATLYSSSMPPLVMISEDGVIRLSSTCFYRHPGRRDLVLLAGDASPLEHEYQYCKTVIDYAKSLKIQEMVSIGTRWTEDAGSPTATPKVKGFATDGEGVNNLQKLGVEVIRDEPAPYFASLIVALAQRNGLRGYKLSVDHGEPIPHPRSVIELLGTLKKMAGFELPTAELARLATKMAENIESVAEEQPPRRPGIYG